jgi:aspartyl-tRNA(Asn)/glutamyl-tRNA(Gln) amidotransferase subunit A
LKRIEHLEPILHAFITYTPELALQMADAADHKRAEQRAAGLPVPPLLGLPLAVKDVLALKDVRCTCGSKVIENFVPPYTATAVQRLLDAGVVVLGKTNTDEFAMGSSPKIRLSAPVAIRGSGSRARGSSGGSAAAVAARMLPAALAPTPAVRTPAGSLLRRHRDQTHLRARLTFGLVLTAPHWIRSAC